MRHSFFSKSLACILLITAAASPVYASGSHYEQALQAYHEGKEQAAYIYLKNALDVQHNNLPAKILMGKLLLQKGYFSQAIAEFEQALAYRADMNLIVADYAAALIFNDEYKKVLTFADGYQLQTPAQFELLINKAVAYQNLDLIELARNTYRQAMSLIPSDNRAPNSLARLELELGNYQAAQQLIRQSLFQQPDDYRTLHLQGRLYFAQEQYQAAITSYNKALAIQPEDPVIRRSIISAYIKAEKMDEARTMLEKVTKATPNDPYIMLLSSWMLSMSQDDQGSIELLENLSKRVSLFSEDDFTNDPSLIFVAAVSSYLQGNSEQASKELNKYLGFKSDDIRAISLLASVYEKQNKLSEAAYLLERHESVVVTDLELALKLVDLYLQTSQRIQARTLLEKLYIDFPGEMDVIIRLVNVLNQSGNLQQARVILENTESSDDNDVRLDLAKGLIYLQNREFDSALQVADLLLKQKPDQIEFLNFKSAVLIKLAKPELAEPIIKQVLQARPNFYEARFNLATVYKQQQKLSEAEEILEDLYDLQPSKANVKVMLGQVYAEQKKLDDATLMLEQVRVGESGRISQQVLFEIYLSQEKYLKAEQVIDYLNDIYLFEPTYILNKAKVLEKLGKLDESKHQLSILFGLANKNTRLLFEVANKQRQLKDFSGSQKTLDALINLIPNNLRVNLEQARLYLAQDKVSKAKEIAWSWANKAPKDPNISLLLGDISYQEGKINKAYDYYSKALSQNNNFNLVLLKLYQLAKEGHKPDQFTFVLQRLIATQPEALWRKKLLADHYVNQNKNDQALPIYLALLETEQFKSDPFLLNNLATIYLEADHEQALAYSRRAHNIEGADFAILDTHGWALYNMGRLDEALEMLRKSHALNSGNKTVRFHLANVLYKLNRNTEAKIELSSALKNSENEDWYNDALSLQKRL